MVGIKEVEVAAERIKGLVRRTPVLSSEKINQMIGREVFFKVESLQITGSFKLRGATNFMLQLTEDQRQAGVVAYSSGNHGKALAYLGSKLGVPVTLVLANSVMEAKLAASRAYGAEIVQYDPSRENRAEIADRLAEERGLVLIPPYEHDWIIAGQGTVGHEFIEQMSGEDLDAVVVPIGGGGLIAGTSLAVKSMSGRTKVYGVEPQNGDDTKQSITRGEIVTIPDPETIVDGLRTNAPGAVPFPYIQKNVDDIYVPRDESVVKAMRLIWDELKLVVEMAGALPLAALIENKLPDEIKRVGLIVSGGNIDIDTYMDIVRR